MFFQLGNYPAGALRTFTEDTQKLHFCALTPLLSPSHFCKVKKAVVNCWVPSVWIVFKKNDTQYFFFRGQDKYRITVELCCMLFRWIEMLPSYNSVRKQINTAPDFASYFCISSNKEYMKNKTRTEKWPWLMKSTFCTPV